MASGRDAMPAGVRGTSSQVGFQRPHQRAVSSSMGSLPARDQGLRDDRRYMLRPVRTAPLHRLGSDRGEPGAEGMPVRSSRSGVYNLPCPPEMRRASRDQPLSRSLGTTSGFLDEYQKHRVQYEMQHAVDDTYVERPHMLPHSQEKMLVRPVGSRSSLTPQVAPHMRPHEEHATQYVQQMSAQDVATLQKQQQFQRQQQMQQHHMEQQYSQRMQQQLQQQMSQQEQLKQQHIEQQQQMEQQQTEQQQQEEEKSAQLQQMKQIQLQQQQQQQIQQQMQQHQTEQQLEAQQPQQSQPIQQTSEDQAQTVEVPHELTQQMQYHQQIQYLQQQQQQQRAVYYQHPMQVVQPIQVQPQTRQVLPEHQVVQYPPQMIQGYDARGYPCYFVPGTEDHYMKGEYPMVWQYGPQEAWVPTDKLSVRPADTTQQMAMMYQAGDVPAAVAKQYQPVSEASTERDRDGASSGDSSSVVADQGTAQFQEASTTASETSPTKVLMKEDSKSVVYFMGSQASSDSEEYSSVSSASDSGVIQINAATAGNEKRTVQVSGLRITGQQGMVKDPATGPGGPVYLPAPPNREALAQRASLANVGAKPAQSKASKVSKSSIVSLAAPLLPSSGLGGSFNMSEQACILINVILISVLVGTVGAFVFRQYYS